MRIQRRQWRIFSLSWPVWKKPEDILGLDVDNLLKIQERLVDNPGNTCMFGPVADGIVIPYDWEEILKGPSCWSGNAIVGCCRHEMIFRRLEDLISFPMHRRFRSLIWKKRGELSGKNLRIMKEWESRGENLTETQKGEKMGSSFFLIICTVHTAAVWPG